jgi:hypothetical protein
VVIRATNTGTVALMPTFTVEFFRGHKHKWDGTNYTSGSSPALAPGRSRDYEADIGASEWAGHPGDSCLVTQENLFQVGEFTNGTTCRARAVPLKVQPSPTRSQIPRTGSAWQQFQFSRVDLGIYNAGGVAGLRDARAQVTRSELLAEPVADGGRQP